MAKKQAERRPPGRIKSSIVARLNTRLFFRLLGIYFTMDLLLTLLFCGGLFVWAEGQAAQISALVEERGVPTAEATEWMGAGSYTVVAGAPEELETGWLVTDEAAVVTDMAADTSAPAENTASTVVITGGTAGQAAEAGSALAPLGFRLPGWLPSPAETEGGVRWFNPGTVDLLFLVTFSTGDTTSYTLYLPHNGDPYTIQIDLSSPAAIFVFAARVLLICQLVSLITNLFKNAGSIKKVLRPIQELAATAAKLNQAERMSPEELRALAERENILWQTSGSIPGRTDAAALQRTKAGVRTAMLSVPVRYHHTPSGLVSMEGVDGMLALTRAFLSDLAEKE